MKGYKVEGAWPFLPGSCAPTSTASVCLCRHYEWYHGLQTDTHCECAPLTCPMRLQLAGGVLRRGMAGRRGAAVGRDGSC